jgi:hypothetical protein
VFSEEMLNEIAYETGFIQRSSKISATTFLDILMLQSASRDYLSLNQLSVGALDNFGVNITKQAIDQKMTDRAVQFVSFLLEKQVMEHTGRFLDNAKTSHFNRIRVKDSTKFDVHQQLKDTLPGFGGAASLASACIQWEFDIKTGSVIDMGITPGNHPDAKDAQEKGYNVQAGDLIIRDLGYFSHVALLDIKKAGAYFLSRLNYNTKIYEASQEGMVELDFGKLYRYMKENGLSQMEKQVFMGKEGMMEVRMIIETMPDEVYEKRIRNVSKQNKKNGYKTSDAYKEKARFNLFVTNVEETMLPMKDISILYKIRWQIELVFKAWKSIYGIHITGKMKLERFLCTLYAKLLLIMVNWEIIMSIRGYIYSMTGKWLSVFKCFETMKSKSVPLQKAIKKGIAPIEGFIGQVSFLFSTKHWLEKRKGKTNFEDIIELINCNLS